MHADIDEMIHLKLEGPLAELLTRVEPKIYSKFIAMERGKKVLYVQLTESLYGTLQAALLFWEALSQYLIGELGFEANPYDRCVANKMISKKQCTCR